MNNADKIIPAYPFVQYSDDENITAFFDAYNVIAQEYLDAFNDLMLPCWTSPMVTGHLLDWVALGVYGQVRPAIEKISSQTEEGPYNTVDYDAIPYANIKNFVEAQYVYMPDDIFKRVLTWNFYKSEGAQFSIPWLKRRLARFIHGEQGGDPMLENTFDISVTVSDGVYILDLPDYGDGVTGFLISCIQQGYVKLPFLYKFQFRLP